MPDSVLLGGLSPQLDSVHEAVSRAQAFLAEITAAGAADAPAAGEVARRIIDLRHAASRCAEIADILQASLNTRL